MEINSYKFHVGKDSNPYGSFGLENHGGLIPLNEKCSTCRKSYWSFYFGLKRESWVFKKKIVAV